MSKRKHRRRKKKGGADGGRDPAATAAAEAGDAADREGETHGAAEGDGGGEARGKGGREKRPKPTRYDWVRENLEAVIVAFVLALIIRHFSVEAFEIPTGSMAPTLYGIHAWSTCPNCGTNFNRGLPSHQGESTLNVDYRPTVIYRTECPECGLEHVASDRTFHCESGICDETWSADPKTESSEETVITSMGGKRGIDYQLECPICQFRFNRVFTSSNKAGGHKILVIKFAYKWRRPDRWDVIVFQYSEEQNYIKRLLGLPGETVSLRGGDLYVKGDGDVGFHIARKESPAAREALWFKIADSSIAEKGYNPVPAWRELFERGSGLDSSAPSKWWTWDENELRWSVNALARRDRIAILRYNRSCVNSYNYNPPEYPEEEVGDKMVAFVVEPTMANPGRGWIGGEIRDREFTFQVRIPVGEASADFPATLHRLQTDGDSEYPSPGRKATLDVASMRTEAAVALPLNRRSLVTFENADDRVRVTIEGAEVLRLDYESGSQRLGRDEHYLQILASSVTADFRQIEMYRDIYYSHAREFRRGEIVDRDSQLAIGTDAYFPCGDNSPSSSDGRYWGTVPERNLMGKAFFIFWPIWRFRIKEFECGFIR